LRQGHGKAEAIGVQTYHRFRSSSFDEQERSGLRRDVSAGKERYGRNVLSPE
jgi:hypothetical protein